MGSPLIEVLMTVKMKKGDIVSEINDSPESIAHAYSLGFVPASQAAPEQPKPTATGGKPPAKPADPPKPEKPATPGNTPATGGGAPAPENQAAPEQPKTE